MLTDADITNALGLVSYERQSILHCSWRRPDGTPTGFSRTDGQPFPPFTTSADAIIKELEILGKEFSIAKHNNEYEVCFYNPALYGRSKTIAMALCEGFIEHQERIKRSLNVRPN